MSDLTLTKNNARNYIFELRVYLPKGKKGLFVEIGRHHGQRLRRVCRISQEIKR